MSEGAGLFPTPSPSREPAAPRAPDAGSYQVLARRARPQAFADVVGQEHVTQTLVNALRSGRVAHAFVFSGMRGVGKTTTARILAKALNCERGPTAEPCNACRNCVEITEGRSLDVFEVDAASQTGIDAARELLETVKYHPAAGRFRIYIIDEAHGLSKQAVDAFLKTLEEPPPHVKFILATTAAHKLPQTILSRCQRYDFRAVAAETVARALGEMVRREGLQADDDALLALARESGGSMRDATSLLDQVLAFSGGRVDAAAIAEALGLPDRRAIRDLIAAAARRDPAQALDVVARVHAQGTDAARFCDGVLQTLRHLTVLAAAGRGPLVDLLPAELDELAETGAGIEVSELQRWFRIVLDAFGDLARAPSPRLVLEMAVLRMATLAPLVPLEDLVARLEALEGGQGVARPAAARPLPRTSGSGSGSTGGGAAASARRGDVPAAPRGGSGALPPPRAGNGGPPPAAPPRAERAASPAEGAAEGNGVAEAGPHHERWQRVVDGLQRERASRFFRLAYSRVVGLDDAALRVAVTGREAANALADRETREAIEAAIEREFGARLRFEAVVPGEAVPVESVRVDRATIDRQAREDPLVLASVELLEGRVEAVVPRTRR